MNSEKDTPILDIARLSSRLAHNNSRVSSFVDSLPGSVDKLAAAICAANWDEVRQVSDDLSRDAAVSGEAVIGESARRLAESAAACDDPREIKRRAIKLIGACGRSGR